MPDRPFTPDSLAARWDCSPATIRNLCRDGKLAHFKVGKEYRIPLRIVEGVETCGEMISGSNSTEGLTTPSGEKAEKPGAGRFVPKIVSLPNMR